MRVTGVPHVLNQAEPTQALSDLWTAVATEPLRLSRWLSQNPKAKGSHGAVVLTPAAVLDSPPPAVTRLRSWTADVLNESRSRVVTGSDLLDHWYRPATKSKSASRKPAPEPVIERPTKSESATMAEVMASIGVGMEPDVRFRGAALAPDSSVVLFWTATDAPATPTDAYQSGATPVYLVRAAGLIDATSPGAACHLGARMRADMGFSTAEGDRLAALMTSLSTGEVKLASVQHRARVVPEAHRPGVGRALVAMALDDGAVLPSRVTLLGKHYCMLGLDETSVMGEIHAHLLGGAPPPVDSPVVVRQGSRPEPGNAIPARPADRAAHGKGTRARSVALDRAAIDRKVAESAEDGALLTDLLAEEPLPPAFAPAIGTLDATQGSNLRTLSIRATWSRAEVDAIAAGHGVLLDGAIDVLNEQAYDCCGEPLIEGNDPLSINPFAVDALLA